MKVCLRAWVDKPYLDKADEIKVPWEKRDIIPNIFEDYPEDKVVILECFEDELTDKDWTDLKMFYGLSKGRFKICASNWRLFKGEGIPFYIGYPITDVFTLQGIINLGVTDVVIAGPLAFDLENVRKTTPGVQLRLVPNVAFNDGLPRDGVIGSWVRPQDIDIYAEYIDVFEFEDVQNKTREQALYRIYFDEKEWMGEMRDLITNFDYDGNCGYLSKFLTDVRIGCKMNCLSGSRCRLCYSSLNFANEKMIEKIESKKNV